MAATTDFLSALVNGGIGAMLGGVAVALINVFGRRGESRATAADLVTNAGVGLIDRLERTNTRLDQENKALRKALIQLTDVIDDVIDELPIDVGNKNRLKVANHAAKEAM